MEKSSIKPFPLDRFRRPPQVIFADAKAGRVEAHATFIITPGSLGEIAGGRETLTEAFHAERSHGPFVESPSVRYIGQDKKVAEFVDFDDKTRARNTIYRTIGDPNKKERGEELRGIKIIHPDEPEKYFFGRVHLLPRGEVASTWMDCYVVFAEEQQLLLPGSGKEVGKGNTPEVTDLAWRPIDKLLTPVDYFLDPSIARDLESIARYDPDYKPGAYDPSEDALIKRVAAYISDPNSPRSINQGVYVGDFMLRPGYRQALTKLQGLIQRFTREPKFFKDFLANPTATDYEPFCDQLKNNPPSQFFKFIVR